MRAAASLYEGRLGHYAKLQVTEVKEARKLEGKNVASAIAAEGDALLAAVPHRAVLYVLDERGQQPTSREFAGQLQKRMVRGDSSFAFVIGGALGLDERVRKAAASTLALSKMTLPHELARVMLFEQLYRAMTIHRGEPYHK
jgi:23S rRNA (pseudouridine1915-N3)-methyltransferase